MMCKVDPNNIVLLRNFGGFFILCAFISILLGKTYCKRAITKIDEPNSFWGVVIIYFLLGSMVIIGTYVC